MVRMVLAVWRASENPTRGAWERRVRAGVRGHVVYWGQHVRLSQDHTGAVVCMTHSAGHVVWFTHSLLIGEP